MYVEPPGPQKVSTEEGICSALSFIRKELHRLSVHKDMYLTTLTSPRPDAYSLQTCIQL